MGQPAVIEKPGSLFMMKHSAAVDELLLIVAGADGNFIG